MDYYDVIDITLEKNINNLNDDPNINLIYDFYIFTIILKV